jgi:hypothetical protein
MRTWVATARIIVAASGIAPYGASLGTNSDSAPRRFYRADEIADHWPAPIALKTATTVGALANFAPPDIRELALAQVYRSLGGGWIQLD